MPIVGVVAVVAAAAIAWFVVGIGNETYTIRGVFSLADEFGDVSGTWDDCEGVGGYDDFDAGQDVSVTNAEGELIGTSVTVSLNRRLLPQLVEIERTLGVFGIDNPEADNADQQLQDLLEEMADVAYYCGLYYEVEVPESDFYTIEIGRRGEVDYSFEELKRNDFFVAPSLGG